jgi:hypothetical protein
MARIIRPWQVLIVATAGWISRDQDAVIEYLREENRVLKQQLGSKRLRLTDAQRRRLAAKGKAIGYRVLSEVATLTVRIARESPSSSRRDYAESKLGVDDADRSQPDRP